MPSAFFCLSATTVVFVGRRVFVGSFKACITLSMQHGRLNSAILFLAIARRSAFFFLSQRLCQLFSSLPMNWPTEAESHFSALMIKKICLLLQVLTAWPSRESSLSWFPFGSSVAMTLLAMDALVERDLASISTQQQGQKKTQRWRWIAVIVFLEKALPTAASTFEPSCSL